MEEEKKKEYFIVKVGDSSFIGLDWKPVEKGVAYGIDAIEPDSISEYIIYSGHDKNNKPLNILSIPGVDNIDDFVKKMPEYEKYAEGNTVKYKMTDTAFSGCVTKVVENYKKSSKKGSKKGGCSCSKTGGCNCSAGGGKKGSKKSKKCSKKSKKGGKKGSKKSKKCSKKSKKSKKCSKKSKKGSKK